MKFQSSNKHLSLLEDYYNHFDEETRLDKKHGYVEFFTNMHYINKYLKDKMTILDIGAGTGKYSLALFEKGYDVTAIDLMQKHVDAMKAKNANLKVYKADALDLSFIDSNSFDMVLLFGPLYHLLKEEDRIKALNEAKRILKDDGVMLISYCMNEYAVISYGFIKNNIKHCKEIGSVDENYHTYALDDDLYAYLRLEDIDRYNSICNLKRVEIISSDGPSDYLRKELNKMDQETYELFLDYHLKICARKELLGAGAHVLDIVKKY